MKSAAVDRDRTTGAAVLRRVGEPAAKEPSHSPQMQPSASDKAAKSNPRALEAHNPQIASQRAHSGAGKSGFAVSPHFSGVINSL
jgi:hypothetical protein